MLNAMLLGKDPQTGTLGDILMLWHLLKRVILGEGLTEANVKAQMLTFLIAGHETTSGMLSFAMAHILKNPEVYAKVQKEVDSVLGREPIKFEHLSKLTYINGKHNHQKYSRHIYRNDILALLRESLRVTPSIGQFAVEPENDEVIGNGKYFIKKGTTVVVMAGDIQRDPSVWGEEVSQRIYWEIIKSHNFLFERPENSIPTVCWMGNSKHFLYVHLRTDILRTS